MVMAGKSKIAVDMMIITLVYVVPFLSPFIVHIVHISSLFSYFHYFLTYDFVNQFNQKVNSLDFLVR